MVKGLLHSRVHSVQSDFMNIRQTSVSLFTPKLLVPDQVRQRNVLKDFVQVAGPLGVTHFIIVSKTEEFINLRICRLPRGPTVTFHVKAVSLAEEEEEGERGRGGEGGRERGGGERGREERGEGREREGEGRGEKGEGEGGRGGERKGREEEEEGGRRGQGRGGNEGEGWSTCMNLPVRWTHKAASYLASAHKC